MTDDDRRRATEDRGSLLYGELLPRGVHKALDARHLDAARASSVYDLGCGTGKVALQAFLQFPNLKRVYGVELSLARFHVAERALLALAARDDCDAHVTRREPGSSIEVTSADRTLIVEHGNLAWRYQTRVPHDDCTHTHTMRFAVAKQTSKQEQRHAECRLRTCGVVAAAVQALVNCIESQNLEKRANSAGTKFLH